ncbi:hypothetical protein [Campylobacter sp.]|uniref:hypothetical protein n=1 Tax=Campylobacter sp. TaxID=205 RepID=UPI0026DC2B12|nr:hypothetical protein [Campylobacter sp.]MDO4674891.1 hypothetical protein [Campylobacter sp.]
MLGALSFLGGFRLLAAAGFAALVIALGLLWWRLEAKAKEAAFFEQELKAALVANEDLFRVIENLRIEHQRHINALWSAKHEGERLMQRVEKARGYIETRRQNGEDNITKLFNDLLERLWDE